MTDVIDARRLFRVLATVLAGVVGLIFAGLGGFLTASQGWDAATGTVGECHPRATGGSTRTIHQYCQVTWVIDGVGHDQEVDLGPGARFPGEPVPLRVHGNLVAVAGPAWVGPTVLGVGLVLAGGATAVLIRGRRRSTVDS